MTLEKVQRILDAHGIVYERKGDSILSRSAYQLNADGTTSEAPEVITVENGAFCVNGCRQSLAIWLGY